MSLVGQGIEATDMGSSPILAPESSQAILNAVPMPILCLCPQDGVSYANLGPRAFSSCQLRSCGA